ncbi:MAG TPA: cytochrome c biogenesis protein CcsA [Candidatus Polarisedimenticolia bacterium]|jgi:ABC-type uncharacterized transport system permease subunit
MSYWSNILLGMALAFYVLGVIASVSVLLARRREWISVIPGLALAGFIVHFAGIVMRGVERGGFPAGDLREVLFLVAWVATSVYLLAHFRLRIEVMGIVILPLVAALMLVTLLIPQGAPGGPGAETAIPEGVARAIRVIHIVPAVLGVSLLFLTFAMSLLYLVQERALKSHRPIRFFLRLPSLERCERLGHQSLTWGFSLLTFVVVTGVITAGYAPTGDWRWVLREKWSLLAWLVFAVVMYDRIFSGGWRGRKAAYLSIFGFSVMILRMIGV